MLLFCPKVHEHLISVDYSLGDKILHQYFADISNLKTRTDVGVVNSLHKYEFEFKKKKWKRPDNAVLVFFVISNAVQRVSRDIS